MRTGTSRRLIAEPGSARRVEMQCHLRFMTSNFGSVISSMA